MVDDLARRYALARGLRLRAELEANVCEDRRGLLGGLAGQLRHLRLSGAGPDRDPDVGADLGGLALAAGRVLGDDTPVVLSGALAHLDLDVEARLVEDVPSFFLGPALHVRQVRHLNAAEVHGDGAPPGCFLPGGRVLLDDGPHDLPALSPGAGYHLELIGDGLRLFYGARVLQARDGDLLDGVPPNLAVRDAADRGEEQEK